MKDYYAILGLKSNASIAEIKKAFRERVKKLHPDLNPKNYTKEFHLLITAYETLSNVKTRSAFDWAFSQQENQKKKSFDYRSWLLQRKDLESRVKLIVYDLLRHREDDAVAMYLYVKKEHPFFSLTSVLDREAFMDIGFILAEELLFRKEYYDAFLLFEHIVKLENEKPYFRHFYSELLKHIHTIVRASLSSKVSPELSIDLYERAIDLPLEKKYTALCFYKAGELYYNMGDTQSAELCFKEALCLDSNTMKKKVIRYAIA